MNKNKIVLAMSGGVDSSVAAVLLREQGYEVIGVTFDLFPISGSDPATASVAAQVAQKLQIEHQTVDLKAEFDREVIADFCTEYTSGRTPNPCVRCNPHIKFAALQKISALLGSGFFGTGHYARVVENRKTSYFELKKGLDSSKDQSYFLYGLSQEQLSRCVFPVGEFSKEQIRQLAREYALPAAERAESQEICFIPDNDYTGFLKNRAPLSFTPGPIKDSSGKIIGRHDGIANFTIGQRRGMGIAASTPLYVIQIDAAENAIVAGPGSELFQNRLHAEHLNKIADASFDKRFRAEVKIRYKHTPAWAWIEPSGPEEVEVIFDQPQRAITPGQAVVFYLGDTVLGGGLIT